MKPRILALVFPLSLVAAAPAPAAAATLKIRASGPASLHHWAAG